MGKYMMMKEKKKYLEKTGGKYSKFQKKKITNLIRIMTE